MSTNKMMCKKKEINKQTNKQDSILCLNSCGMTPRIRSLTVFTAVCLYKVLLHGARSALFNCCDPPKMLLPFPSVQIKKVVLKEPQTLTQTI